MRMRDFSASMMQALFLSLIYPSSCSISCSRSALLAFKISIYSLRSFTCCYTGRIRYIYDYKYFSWTSHCSFYRMTVSMFYELLLWVCFSWASSPSISAFFNASWLLRLTVSTSSLFLSYPSWVFYNTTLSMLYLSYWLSWLSLRQTCSNSAVLSSDVDFCIFSLSSSRHLFRSSTALFSFWHNTYLLLMTYTLAANSECWLALYEISLSLSFSSCRTLPISSFRNRTSSSLCLISPFSLSNYPWLPLDLLYSLDNCDRHFYSSFLIC